MSFASGFSPKQSIFYLFGLPRLAKCKSRTTKRAWIAFDFALQILAMTGQSRLLWRFGDSLNLAITIFVLDSSNKSRNSFRQVRGFSSTKLRNKTWGSLSQLSALINPANCQRYKRAFISVLLCQSLAPPHRPTLHLEYLSLYQNLCD